MVGAGPGHDIDQAARVQPLLCAHGRGLNTKLGDRVGEGERQVDVGLVIVVVAPIQPVISKIALAAGDGDNG